MKIQHKQQRRKIPFWKRWLFWVIFVSSSLLSVVFIVVTVMMPFLYEIEDPSRGVMVYAMGMSMVLAVICADSARRVYRKLQPQS
ncbi:MAG: hypothetical protein Q9P01_20920 [Anaerolineae bacterium]|nr:hypothetical protein [Anaerolineae bacterium]MDQ7037210.1 hypothetical protein [Anaerolineae bacterium]